MHRIVENGVEKKVSFDTWQTHTNIRYEDDKKGSRSTKVIEKSTSETASRRVNPKFHPIKPKNKASTTSNKTSTPNKPTGRSKSVAISRADKDRTTNNLPVRASSTSRRRSSLGGTGRQSLNIDPKHFVIGSSTKRPLIGGSHYSRALLVNAHPLTKGPGPDNLQYLENVDHLFFKQCKRFPPEIQDFHPTEKRGIWNSGGRCVYYVGLTHYYMFKRFRSGFTYEVVDYLGRPVLTSSGSQWSFGLKGSVTVKLGNGHLLGSMEQEVFGSLYNIRDGQGRVVYTIQSPCYAPAVPFVVWCFREEFEICMDDTISEIGRVTQDWGEEFPDFDGDLGIEFEASDDNRVKALLLGVYFLIEFQYFKYGGNGVSYFVVMLIIVSLISFLLSNGFGFVPQIKSPLIP